MSKVMYEHELCKYCINRYTYFRASKSLTARLPSFRGYCKVSPVKSDNVMLQFVFVMMSEPKFNSFCTVNVVPFWFAGQSLVSEIRFLSVSSLSAVHVGFGQ